MRLRTLSRRELEMIKNQLGRAPRGTKGIVKTCSSGKPMVILTTPVLLGEVLFPTCFWLTCPVLNKKVGQLESEGQIKVLQRILDKDEKLLVKTKEAHKDYRMLRQSLLKKLDGQTLSPNQKKAIKRTGVAGVSDLTKIKCLHAHYAHFLATGKNPIGEVVHKKLGALDCKKECGAN